MEEGHLIITERRVGRINKAVVAFWLSEVYGYKKKRPHSRILHTEYPLKMTNEGGMVCGSPSKNNPYSGLPAVLENNQTIHVVARFRINPGGRIISRSAIPRENRRLTSWRSFCLRLHLRSHELFPLIYRNHRCRWLSGTFPVEERDAKNTP